eukprot:1190136-Prorocentrum_minimum.AAC.2
MITGGSFGFFHDFAVTEHYYIFYQNPVRMDGKRLVTEYLFGKCGIAQVRRSQTLKPLNP